MNTYTTLRAQIALAANHNAIDLLINLIATASRCFWEDLINEYQLRLLISQIAIALY